MSRGDPTMPPAAGWLAGRARPPETGGRRECRASDAGEAKGGVCAEEREELPAVMRDPPESLRPERLVTGLTP
jgi:hypothetical protein